MPDSVDFLISSGNNSSDDAQNENDAIYIKKSELEPVNDPKCQHPRIEIDPTEELGIAYMCQDCHIGWIQAK